MHDHKQMPAEIHGLADIEIDRVYARVADHVRQLMQSLQIESMPGELLRRIHLPLAAALANMARGHGATLVIGINGAQGSGKTTLCQLLTHLLAAGFGLRVASVSIDDLYRTRSERRRLGRTVHPLLETRGVPGTHDIAMGRQLLAELKCRQSGLPVVIPVFDKAIDDRAPRSAWRTVQTPLDIVLFEGWCVGARPQRHAELRAPVNPLEEREDPHGIWRSHVNQQLADDYQQLFAALDLLVMLEVPGMESVFAWRRLQEQKLAGQRSAAITAKLMDEQALVRFIMHYERLTRHMLAEMPGRADMVLRLGQNHQVEAVRINSWPAAGGGPS